MTIVRSASPGRWPGRARLSQTTDHAPERIGALSAGQHGAICAATGLEGPKAGEMPDFGARVTRLAGEETQHG